MIDLANLEEFDANAVSGHQIMPILITLTLVFYSWIRLEAICMAYFVQRNEHILGLRLLFNTYKTMFEMFIYFSFWLLFHIYPGLN